MPEHAFLNPEQVSSIIKLGPLMEDSYFPVALDAGAGVIHLDYIFWDGRLPIRITIANDGSFIAVADWVDGVNEYSKDNSASDWSFREDDQLEKQLRAVLEA